MSVNRQYAAVHDALTTTLRRLTGLELGEFAAHILAGGNPSMPAEVEQFARAMRERRATGKKHRTRDVDALLDMVSEHMAYQALSGRDRVTFARTIMQRVLPTLKAADLESMSQADVSQLEVTDTLADGVRELVDHLL